VLLASELSSLKGPVPLASVARSRSCSAFSGRIAIPLKAPMRSNRFGVGWLSRITTVRGSGASTAATLANRSALVRFSSMIRR
jgi:hypothetical protein